MTVPPATKITAFLTGLSLGGLIVGLGVLESHGIVAFSHDSRVVNLFFGVYFFVTTIVFVVGVHNLFPSEHKTQIPFVYFPTNRAGWLIWFRVWGRMLVWFLGVGTVWFGLYFIESLH